MSTDDNPCLLLDCTDGVFTITLNRPAHRNALTLPMWDQLGSALRSVDGANFFTPRTIREVAPRRRR